MVVSPSDEWILFTIGTPVTAVPVAGTLMFNTSVPVACT